ncbi:MAG TPA: amidohydrolase family protein [Chthoniobacterales bacterium]
MILYRARHLVSMDGPPVENGGILVSLGKIAAVGRFDDIRALVTQRESQIVDLGERILLPGLINAHCHLELTPMLYTVLTETSFAKWIQRINAAKRHFSDDDYLAGIEKGATQLAQSGTTTVLNIESYPELLNRLPVLPTRVWWFYEMLDVRLRIHDDSSMRGAMSIFHSPENSGMRHFGLSPHAPYTASPALFRLALEAARSDGLPFTTHVAESQEEMQMFRDASGPLFDFLASLGRPMEDCGGTTPFRTLVEKGMIDPFSILVHLNELDASDFSLIPRFTAGHALQVVHCPKSHAFFHHSPFPFERLRDLGARISLGTDSLASNSTLDMFSEMRTFAKIYPTVSPVEILRMVTLNPARSINLEKTLGSLRIGAWADAIAIPAPKNGRDIFASILHHGENSHPAVDWMLVNGTEVSL